MIYKITTIVLFISLGLFTACSESTTGPNQDTDQTEQEEEPGETTTTTGTLEVTTSTSGNTTDEDGYTITVDGESESVAANETITFAELEEGTYSVELSGLANACSMDGDNPVDIDITAGETTTVEFTVTCQQSTAEGLIAFSQRVDGVFELFTIEADGSNKQQLTSGGLEKSWVDISPDGTQVAFAQQDPATTKYDIWVMDINGENATRLTNTQSNDRHPAWSPDGTKIAFETERDGNFNIYVMNVDGSGQTALTTSEKQEIQPTWAPEGDKIAFISDDDADGISDIFSVNSDGTGLEKILQATSNTGMNIFDPEWSPDATQIAYQGFATNGAASIYIADLDAGTANKITSTEVSAYQPTWSPDGNYIAFTNLASANNSDEIWIIKSDGSSLYKVTAEETYSAFPSWGITVE